MALNSAHFAETAMVIGTAVGQPLANVGPRAWVLLIDHESDPASGLVQVLEAAGYRCMCSTCAETAVGCVRKQVPDLIISDTNVAGHSGVALCERLMQAEGLTGVPLMFFSGIQIPDIIRRSHAAGGTYYLRKPFDPEVLLALIEKALWSQPGLPRAVACI